MYAGRVPYGVAPRSLIPPLTLIVFTSNLRQCCRQEGKCEDSESAKPRELEVEEVDAHEPKRGFRGSACGGRCGGRHGAVAAPEARELHFRIRL